LSKTLEFRERGLAQPVLCLGLVLTMTEDSQRTAPTALSGRVGLVCWAISISLLSAFLMARHLVALPRPTEETTASAFAKRSTPGEQARWRAVHVLSASCGCSMRVLAHLSTSARPAGVAERILWVGPPSAETAAAERRGFIVTPVTSAELGSVYHIEAVPLLLVLDESGRVRYSGGYSNRKQGRDLEDLQIIGELQAGRATASLPVFGCAVSRDLQRALNPLIRLADALQTSSAQAN